MNLAFLEAMVLWKFIAGVGIFLLAMHFLETALKELAGDRLRRFIRNNTDSPLKGVLTGTVATAILQSSSLVTLILMAFVGAGILSVQNALGVIYGSNLGTTLTGWAVALLGFKLNIQSIAYPLLGLGALFFTLTYRYPKISRFFKLIVSLGLLLLGLEFMKAAMAGIAEQISPETLEGYGTLTYFAIGLILTALIQSSSATMLITLTALNSSMIGLADAGAIVIGADLGTTVTALLGSLGGKAPRIQTALAHFSFNFVTDMVALALLQPLVYLASKLMGAGEPLLALVLFHSLFNFIGILIFLPLTPRFAALLQRTFPSGQSQIQA